MTRWRHWAGGRAAVAAAVLCLAVVGGLDSATPGLLIALYSVAPLVAAAALDERGTAVFAAVAVAFAIGSGWLHGVLGDVNYWSRSATVLVVSAMAVVVARSRRRREERLARMTAVAEAAQRALLPPLPAEMTGVTIAARYLSATREALVGGDLYDVVPAQRGLRAIIGDVRGKGLDAVRLAGQVLTSFRCRAVMLPTLEQVAADMDRAVRPLLGEEEFVTAALVEVSPAGGLTIVNRGHHPPLLRHGDVLSPLAGSEAGLPFGLGEDCATSAAAWSPGDRLLLYTDGLVESRDAHGNFLPPEAIDTALLAQDCDQALDTLVEAVRRHTGGLVQDDMALLLLERGLARRPG